LRLFQDGIVGEQGPPGDTGQAGTNGVDAYTVVLAPFATPSLEHPYVQIVSRLNANIVTGENIFIESSGWYNVVGTDGTGVLFCNLIARLSDAVAIVPVGALIVPAGQTGVGTKGETGDKGIKGDQGIQGPKGLPGNDAVSVTQNNGFFFTTTGNDYNLLAFADEDFHPVWFSVASPAYPPITPTAADPRFTLPNAGTYLIVGKTAANVQSTTTVKLFSVTNNFDVPGSVQQISPSAANEFRHCPFAVIYTAGGADTIQLYASRILGFMDGGLAGANNTVFDIAVQNDGKVLVAGSFTLMDATQINGIARLNVDGTVDTAFNAGVVGPAVPGVNAGAVVNTIGLLSDGRIVVGGNFISYRDTTGNHTVSKFAILNTDGTLYSDLVTSHATFNNVGIYSLDVQSDDKVVVTGDFTSVGGTARRRIARLATIGGPGTTGFLDLTFGSTTSGLNGTGFAIKVLAGGLIMVGGAFTAAQTMGGGNVAKTGRLSRFDNTTGLPDSTWASTTASQFNSTVYAIEEQTIDFPTTGQILVGGSFLTYNATSSPRFIQLTSAGAVATASAGFNNDVRTIALDGSGNFIIGGLFTKFGPATTNQTHLSRITPAGSLDSTLGDVNIGVAGDTVYSAVIQSDGKILIGGTFISVQTLLRGRIARLLSDGTLNTVPAGLQTIPYLYTDITWTQIA